MKRLVLASANPGKVHALGATPGTRGTFTSKPKDTDTVSSWGRLRWVGTVPTGTSVDVAATLSLRQAGEE